MRKALVLLVTAFILLILVSCGNGSESEPKKASTETSDSESKENNKEDNKKKTIEERFADEGGVIAYRVRRQYGEDSYIIIDMNNKEAYAWTNNLQSYSTLKIENIKRDSFEINGRKYHYSPSYDLDSVDAKLIEFSRTNRTNHLKRIDLKDAQINANIAKRNAQKNNTP